MGNPRFLDGAIYPFRYYSESVPANTSTQITTTLRAELTALSWTEPVAKTFRSPANAAGRYMDLVVTEPSSATWQMALYDSFGTSICTRRIEVNVGMVTTVEYYTGKAHVFIDSNYGGGARQIYAFLTDPFPDEERFYDHPVVGNGSLNTSSTFDTVGYLQYCWAVDGSASTYAQRAKTFSPIGGTTYSPVMPSGRYLYDALWISQNVGGTICWTGKCIQALLGPAAAAYSDWVIPINYAASATFRATSLGDGFVPYRRLFMRKA